MGDDGDQAAQLPGLQTLEVFLKRLAALQIIHLCSTELYAPPAMYMDPNFEWEVRVVDDIKNVLSQHRYKNERAKRVFDHVTELFNKISRDENMLENIAKEDTGTQSVKDAIELLRGKPYPEIKMDPMVLGYIQKLEGMFLISVFSSNELNKKSRIKDTTELMTQINATRKTMLASIIQKVSFDRVWREYDITIKNHERVPDTFSAQLVFVIQGSHWNQWDIAGSGLCALFKESVDNFARNRDGQNHCGCTTFYVRKQAHYFVIYTPDDEYLPFMFVVSPGGIRIVQVSLLWVPRSTNAHKNVHRVEFVRAAHKAWETKAPGSQHRFACFVKDDLPKTRWRFWTLMSNLVSNASFANTLQESPNTTFSELLQQEHYIQNKKIVFSPSALEEEEDEQPWLFDVFLSSVYSAGPPIVLENQKHAIFCTYVVPNHAGVKLRQLEDATIQTIVHKVTAFMQTGIKLDTDFLDHCCLI